MSLEELINEIEANKPAPDEEAVFFDAAHVAAILVNLKRSQRMEGVIKQCLPDWHAEDDGTLHGGKIAGEITYADLRALKQALEEKE